MISTTILIVDDHESSALMLEMALTDLGFNVLTAFNALDAIEAVEKQKIDVLIVDYDMPDMNGDDLTHKITSMQSIRKKIMVSALDLSETGLISQFDRILSKPVEFDVLENMLSKWRQ